MKFKSEFGFGEDHPVKNFFTGIAHKGSQDNAVSMKYLIRGFDV
jgi:hypothetical protein